MMKNLHMRWWEWGIALVLLAAVSIGATMFSVAKFDEARAGRIAADESDEISVDSIYTDRIESRYDADYDRSRYRAMAESLSDEPIHIDGYQAFDIDDADLEAIRTELEDLDVPIYVAILSTSKLDDADGDADILAARIAAELPDDRATVLVIGNSTEGIADKGAVRKLENRPSTAIDDSTSAEALTYVRALAAAEVAPAEDAYWYSRTLDSEGDLITVDEDRRSDPRDLRYGYGSSVAGIVFGLLVGGGVGAGGMLIWRRAKKGEE